MKMAQAVHAALLFGETYPHIQKYWYHESNNVAVLQNLVEEPLPALAARLEREGFRLVRFEEPDLDNQLTAIGVEPAARRRLSNLPLAR